VTIPLTYGKGKVKIAQISCGTEWSGIQPELNKAAELVGAEIFFPEASLEDIELGVEKLGFSPASHNLRVMLGQALALENYRDVDGIILLTCFRCAEGSLTRTVLRRYLESKFNLPIISYSFTERTKAENLLLRLEALSNIIRRRPLLDVRRQEGISLGIDSGSSWTKAALMEEGEVVGFSALPTTDILDTALKVVEKAVNGVKIRFSLGSDPVGVTGYGRYLLSQKLKARIAMDEITVCAKGATFLTGLFSGDATIIDIGGNDNKAISIHDGIPYNFTVGGICAGASGRFLEVVAARLGVSVSELGELALRGDPNKVRMNAYCIVFGIQDLVAALAAGARKEDVAAAACFSVAEQFFQQQLQEIEVRQPIIEVGGTSLNRGLVKAIEKVVHSQVKVPPYSQFAGAVGAAVLASNA
jgi:putative methanogenesis marker protein 15